MGSYVKESSSCHVETLTMERFLGGMGGGWTVSVSFF